MYTVVAMEPTVDHDLLRHTQQLQQALASNKVPIGLLLGAGCPVAVRTPDGAGRDTPLIPALAGLTQRIHEIIASTSSAAHLKTITVHLEQDGIAKPNVENILSHVRALRVAAGSSEARGLKKKDLDDLDEAICHAIDEVVRRDLPDHLTPYHRFATWVGAIERQHPLQVFTTNYDLLFEQAFETRRVPYFDGFVGASRAFFDLASMEETDDRFPSRWARLWKLHGSINWRQVGDRTVRTDGAGVTGERRLIHPSHLKYDESRRMPYLAMIDRLRAFLRRTPAVLVTCGFSFSDPHLNEIVEDGLRANPNAVCFALLFGELSSYALALPLARRRPNVTLLCRDGAVIGTREGRWSLDETAAPPRDWIARKTPGNGGTSGSWECRLGDFQCLGEFLADQMRARTAPEPRSDGA
jgi:hypothetical protein